MVQVYMIINEIDKVDTDALVRTYEQLLHILKATANWSPYIFTLVQKKKHWVYKIHVFLSEAILCRDSASYSI